jgi:hypothetical protein
MAKHSRHTVLSDTATHDKKSGDLRAVIETPKGSRNKYRYDPDCDCFSLATTHPDGMAKKNPYGVTPAHPAGPAAHSQTDFEGQDNWRAWMLSDGASLPSFP